MVNRNIISKLGLTNEEIEQEVNELYSDQHNELLAEALDEKIGVLVAGTILKGKIVVRLGNDVIVEIGLKSEGIVEAAEFDDPEEIAPGNEIEVLLEDIDAEGGAG